MSKNDGSHGIDGPSAKASSPPRRFPRYTVDMRISVQVFRPSGSVSLWGRSHELGEDGIGGTLTGEVEPGEVVSMELTLPMTAHPMKLRALVRYRSGLRHGFEFLALDAVQKETLARTCAMLAVAP